MVKPTATEFEPTAVGVYKAKLIKVEESTGDFGDFWRWGWELKVTMDGDAVPADKKDFFINSSTNFGTRSNARRWYESMTGTTLATGDQPDFDEEIVGGTYWITIGINNKLRNTLDSVLPLKKKPVPVEDTEDVPF